VRGLRRDAERSPMAATVSKAHELCPRFSQKRCAGMVHAPGLLHIGEAAYFGWADPPNFGCTAQRHGEEQRRTTSALTTLKQLVVQCEGAWSMASVLPAPPGRSKPLSTAGQRRAWTSPSGGVPHSGRRGDRGLLLGNSIDPRERYGMQTTALPKRSSNRASARGLPEDRAQDWRCHAGAASPGTPAGTTREEVRAYEGETVRATW
jgi:hypothetical protein